MQNSWECLIHLIPQVFQEKVQRHRKDLLEIRMRLGYPVELVTMNDFGWLSEIATQEQIDHVVNIASRYSPWTTDIQAGYITAAGGHRIGLAGIAGGSGFRQIQGLNIRVCRDMQGVSDGIEPNGNILIIGPPGSGKSTMLRDLSRRASYYKSVTVVDERTELFPEGFQRGRRMDVLTGFAKPRGIYMALRTLGPHMIALDEITAQEDCDAMVSATWCGVNLMATAHAASPEDLMGREVYKPIVRSGLFDRIIVMRPDKSWKEEKVNLV